MTNAAAIALPPAAIVRHTNGALYDVQAVITQRVLIADHGRWFSSNPLPIARVCVVDHSQPVGPVCTFDASTLTELPFDAS